MKRIILIVLLLVVASCAGVSNYPLELSYKPEVRKAPAEKGNVTVLLFNDKRKVRDKKVIGMKDDETRFVSLIGEPASAVSNAFRAYLGSKGYSAVTVNEPWDGNVRSLKPEWGDIVVGGDIEDLAINTTMGIPKIEYICSVKLLVIVADARKETILHQERVDASSSYVTVYFSRDKAEELINETLADAMKKALGKMDEYVPDRQ